MLLWDILIKEHECGIIEMSQIQQLIFSACCICESLSFLKQKDNFYNSTEDCLQQAINLAIAVASGLVDNISIEKGLVDRIEDFIYENENSSLVPGLYDISMAIFLFLLAIERNSIQQEVLDIASYSYQSILDIEIMYNLPQESVTESELVIIERNNPGCTQIISSQIDWYMKIKDPRYKSKGDRQKPNN